MRKPAKKVIPILLPQGVRDIVPDEQRYWHAVFRKVNGLLSDYGFARADLAPVELADLYIRSHGAGDEQVEKRLLSARTKDGLAVAFRYQLAPSFMRMYLQYGMHTLPQPVKVFATAPVVRQDESVTRAAVELGVQTIGDSSEAVDAELIFLGCRILEALNLGTFSVRMNTIGDAQTRQQYARTLREYYRSRGKKMCSKCRAFTRESILMALECTQEECRDVNKDAPQILDYLSEEARAHFKHLLEFLDEGKVPYILDPHLVRHEDYAANTVFEFAFEAQPASERDAAHPAQVVIRGGRWDRLSELLGGSRRGLPAAGWSLDLGVLVERLKARGVSVPEPGGRPKVFLSQLGEAAKKRSLMLFEEIRKSGIEIRYSLSRDTIKGQLRMAARLGVRYALIFGQKEALEGTVILREMETGIQETIPQEKIIDTLKKRLKAK